MLHGVVPASAPSTGLSEASPGSVLCAPRPAHLASQELSQLVERQLVCTERWELGQAAAGSRGECAVRGSNYAGAIFCLHKNTLSN